MKKILCCFITTSITLLFSCSNDDVSNKEMPVYYSFSSSSILDPKDEQDKKVEINIDGFTHTDIAPFTWNYSKNTILNETHIKIKVNSNKNTTLTYQIIKERTFNEKGNIKNNGTIVISTGFKDKLDTIIKLK
ncbi:hypothetical protein [Chishuiella sp.]|uniref:hypothetical protein n=1 Tax=Chishuiella sp. TaxID=1969467 RepID=UPI0028B105C9|nr:hypothetical protein [Chishuiella sp.]